MTWTRNKHLLLILTAILLNTACYTSRSNGTETYYKVIKVVDGDTFWIDDGTEKGRKVRLIGVDAPESRRTGRKEAGYYGKESKDFLARLLSGNEVRIEYDVDPTDRYGRALAYVYLEDGTFVNAELVKQGFAMVMTVPPNVKFADEFVRHQKNAREHQRGLWAK
ncbi:MAG: thermonuclease family protein [Chryseosolibacter sp.]